MWITMYVHLIINACASEKITVRFSMKIAVKCVSLYKHFQHSSNDFTTVALIHYFRYEHLTLFYITVWLQNIWVFAEMEMSRERQAYRNDDTDNDWMCESITVNDKVVRLVETFSLNVVYISTDKHNWRKFDECNSTRTINPSDNWNRSGK